ncbi:MAG TPA: hypothetical protein VHG72_10035 [Polyangia bacterium]|nr:hypothetical protein [Polyangia bacterium]
MALSVTCAGRWGSCLSFLGALGLAGCGASGGGTHTAGQGGSTGSTSTGGAFFMSLD